MMRSKAVEEPSGQKNSAMTSTLRCFEVLGLFTEEPFELGISDISELLSIPRASAHRLCTTLIAAGFVERIPTSKRYRLTPKSLWVGSGYLRHSAIYRAAFLPMQVLVQEVPAQAQLAVLFEEEILIIYSIGNSGSTDAFADVGLRRAIHATASGKLFLAAMPREQAKQLMRGAVKYTESTIVSISQMEEDLARISVRGYAVNDEELTPGFVTLAAPAYDSNHHTVAAISITLPADRAHAEEAAYIRPLCEAAKKTSLLLGHNQHSRTLQPGQRKLFVR